jgi:ApaG protein
MRQPFIEPKELWVKVDRVVYYPAFEAPPDKPYCFVYFITIYNETGVTVTIKGRKWVVTNAGGEITAVEGDGIIGQFPIIPNGENFSYNSFHLLDTKTGFAEGSYLGIDAMSRRVVTRIPRFEMAVPEK